MAGSGDGVTCISWVGVSGVVGAVVLVGVVVMGGQVHDFVGEVCMVVVIVLAIHRVAAVLCMIEGLLRRRRSAGRSSVRCHDVFRYAVKLLDKFRSLKERDVGVLREILCIFLSDQHREKCRTLV